MFEEEY